MPRRHGLLSEPHHDAARQYQRRIVGRPVRHPVSGPGEFVASAFAELVQDGFLQPAARDGEAMLWLRRQPRHSSGTHRGAPHPTLSPGRAVSYNRRSIHVGVV
jgi:hypothetical protein